MQQLEYRFEDKSDWGDGEWQSEPDKLQWIDEKTGLPCLIHRGPSGALCGYVGVSKGHPFYQLEYSHEAVDVSVHGGLTFSSFCGEKQEDGSGICHTVEEGEDDKVWWLGFDCAHSMDYSPAYAKYKNTLGFPDLQAGEIYRNLDYVKSECVKLASQLTPPNATNVIQG